MNLKKHVVLFAGIFFCTYLMAQRSSEILSVSASVNQEKASQAFDKDQRTVWEVDGKNPKLDFNSLLISMADVYSPNSGRCV